MFKKQFDKKVEEGKSNKARGRGQDEVSERKKKSKAKTYNQARIMAALVDPREKLLTARTERSIKIRSRSMS